VSFRWTDILKLFELQIGGKGVVNFFANMGNNFDVVVVAISVTEAAMTRFHTRSSREGHSGLSAFGVLRILRVLKSTRVLRILRLFRCALQHFP
jgi:hypothetical protein